MQIGLRLTFHRGLISFIIKWVLPLNSCRGCQRTYAKLQMLLHLWSNLTGYIFPGQFSSSGVWASVFEPWNSMHILVAKSRASWRGYWYFILILWRINGVIFPRPIQFIYAWMVCIHIPPHTHTCKSNACGNSGLFYPFTSNFSWIVPLSFRFNVDNFILGAKVPSE